MDACWLSNDNLALMTREYALGSVAAIYIRGGKAQKWAFQGDVYGPDDFQVNRVPSCPSGVGPGLSAVSDPAAELTRR